MSKKTTGSSKKNKTLPKKSAVKKAAPKKAKAVAKPAKKAAGKQAPKKTAPKKATVKQKAVKAAPKAVKKAAKPVKKAIKKTAAKKAPLVKKAVKKAAPKKAVAKKPVAKAKPAPKKIAKKTAPSAAKKAAPKKLQTPLKKAAPAKPAKAAKAAAPAKNAKPEALVKPAAVKETPAPKAAPKAKPQPAQPVKKQIIMPPTYPKLEVPASVKAMKEPPGKVEIEFVIRVSAEMLYEFLSTPSGLSEWFCDDVNIRNGIYSFVWEGQTQQALLVKDTETTVRFQWIDKHDGSYFEFRIQKDDLTNDISLMITDFASDKGEEESIRLLWKSQVDKLLHVLGSYF